jgi:hypothetical protein
MLAGLDTMFLLCRFWWLRPSIQGNYSMRQTMMEMRRSLHCRGKSTASPWRSPYLRWRLETYSGQRAETVRLKDFWELFWKEKRQLLRFLRWTGEIKAYSERPGDGRR